MSYNNRELIKAAEIASLSIYKKIPMAARDNFSLEDFNQELILRFFTKNSEGTLPRIHESFKDNMGLFITDANNFFRKWINSAEGENYLGMTIPDMSESKLSQCSNYLQQCVSDVRSHLGSSKRDARADFDLNKGVSSGVELENTAWSEKIHEAISKTVLLKAFVTGIPVSKAEGVPRNLVTNKDKRLQAFREEVVEVLKSLGLNGEIGESFDDVLEMAHSWKGVI